MTVCDVVRRFPSALALTLILLPSYACAVKRTAQSVNGVARTSIVLGIREGTCRIESKTHRVQVKRSDQILWNITNLCTDNKAISLRFIRDNPVDGALSEENIPPGETRVMPARVKRDAKVGKYAYEVWVDKRRGDDPEVMVSE